MKKFLCSAAFIGMLFSFMPAINGGYTNQPQNQEQSPPLNKFDNYVLIELLAMIIETFNIMSMGSTSDRAIKYVGGASACMHSLKILHTLSFNARWTALCSDLYFLFKDTKKIADRKALVIYYKENKKRVLRAKGKRWIQVIILVIVALVRIHRYQVLSNELKKGGYVVEELDVTLLISGAIEFFRKRSRYNAEFNEHFETWLLNNADELG